MVFITLVSKLVQFDHHLIVGKDVEACKFKIGFSTTLLWQHIKVANMAQELNTL